MINYENLSEKIKVCVSENHRFGTDAILLANFSAPKSNSLCCDLGTGCGIIPLVFCRNFNPKTIYGVDIQEQAIGQFKLSLENSQITQEIIPVLGDLKSLKDMPFGSFDLVTCNPPYKAEGRGILSETKAEQLARHELSCTIEDVCAAAKRLLQFNGRLCVCQRPERLCDVMEAMRAHSIEPKRLRFVAKDKASAPWLFLLEGNKCAKPFLKVMPTLCLYENGKYTKEMQEIYSGQFE